MKRSARERRRVRVLDTTIGPAAVFEGDLRCGGSIHCSGTVVGHLTAEGDVVLSRSGVVKGDVRGADVTVGGRVEGDVHASGLLVVQSTAVVTGRLSMARLVVDEGAYLQGTFEMEPRKADVQETA